MDRSSMPRLSAAGSEQVLRQLTTQQHLKPARSVAQTVAQVCQSHGFPETAGQAAIALLGVPGERSVGRLSRQQIRELAQKMEFSWQMELAGHLRTNPSPANC